MDLQEELRVNYCHLAVVSTDPPEITDAFRIGLGATFTFLSDYEHKAIIELDMAEIVDPDFKGGMVAIPYTFPCYPISLSTRSTMAGGLSGGRRAKNSGRTCVP